MNRPTATVPDHSVYPARPSDPGARATRRPAHAAPVSWDLDDDPGDPDHGVEIDLASDVVDLTRMAPRALPRGRRPIAAAVTAIATTSRIPEPVTIDVAAERDLTESRTAPIEIDGIERDGAVGRAGANETIVAAAAPASNTDLSSLLGSTPSAAAGTTVGRSRRGRVSNAFVEVRCWLRRHATWQIAAPCLAGVITGTAALLFADGAAQRFGQVVVTAALVTIGFAWTQSVQDQRRRQHDLRFRLATGNLERADLSGTVLDGFTLWGQNLRGARLSGCSADHVLLSGADLRDASMSGISLRAASLCGADLTGAHAYRADLTAADLTGAIVVGTGLEQAVLRGARLEGADLRDADLSGADLRGATHDAATMWDRAVVSADTHLPEDLDPGTAGLILDGSNLPA